MTTDLKQKFTLTVPADMMQKKMDEKIESIRKEAKIQGFRPGQAPKALIEAKYKNAIKEEALQELLAQQVTAALQEREIKPAVQPRVDIVSYEEGKDIVLDVQVEALPEITIPKLSDIKLTRLKATAGDEEITEAINKLAQHRRSTEVIDPRATKERDIVVIDFVGSIDGEEFKGGSGKDYYLDLGSNTFIPGFEEQLLGKEIGDTVDVNVTFPDDYHAKDLAGKKALFKVTLKELRQMKDPEINDEFAKGFGADSLEGLKNTIKEELDKDYVRLSKLCIKKALLDALDEQATFPAPESMVDLELGAIGRQYETAKKNGQLDAEDLKKSEEQLKQEYKVIADRRVRLGLLMNKIIQDEKLTATKEDLSNAILQEARRFPGQESQVFEYYQKNPKAMEMVQANILEEKATENLISKVSVTEKEVSAKELHAIADSL